MEYFSQRHNLRKVAELTSEINCDVYTLLLDCCLKQYRGNVLWKFYKVLHHQQVVFDKSKFYEFLGDEIPDLNKNILGDIVTPTEMDDYKLYALLDLIEFFAHTVRFEAEMQYLMRNKPMPYMRKRPLFYRFQEDINKIFKRNNLAYILAENKEIERIVENTVISDEINNHIGQISEEGTKELLQEAITLFKQPHPNSRKLAVEKIWDALERLKTFYTPQGLDKKGSAEKIITDMSNSQQEFIDLFNTEFKELTKIGNEFTIRHHEVNKTDILDERHYDYFFNRCLSLIALAIQYLK